MEKEQAVCGQCGTMSLDCMVYAYCPKCEAERRRDLVPGFAVKQLVEMVEADMRRTRPQTKREEGGHCKCDACIRKWGPFDKVLAAVRDEMGS